MSRVTIGDLIEAVIPFTEESDKIIPIEVVPRKIVEEIIEVCSTEIRDTELDADVNHPYEKGVYNMAVKIRGLAKSRLNEFEEGRHDSNNQ